MIIALVVIGATLAVVFGPLEAAQYVAILTMCVQAVLAYKVLAAQAQPKP